MIWIVADVENTLVRCRVSRKPRTLKTKAPGRQLPFSRERRNLDAAKVYEAMGGYAPTIGIIGAVMGLIHVMGNLADPSMLGSGIAVAFVATIYGVGLANLFLIPVANKLRAYVRHESHVREMVIAGLMAIAEGENPRSISDKLKGFYEDA